MYSTAPASHPSPIVDMIPFNGGPDVHAETNRLLIVDDEAGVTRAIAMIARELAFDVQIVNTPGRALDAFLSFRPHVAMIDMIMPEKDGIDVLNVILLTGIPVHLMLTSGFSENYLRLAEAVVRFHDGARYSILRKPFRRHELITALSRLVVID
jgi:two-component system KDP operon response regulator KdpE